MAGSLAGAPTKLARAKYHLESFAAVQPASAGATMGTGAGSYLYPVTPQVYNDGLEYRFYVGQLPPFDPEPFALIAGDCLFNLRAALDHLVYDERERLRSRNTRGAAIVLGAPGPSKRVPLGQRN
jgi:hypothetical protein